MTVYVQGETADFAVADSTYTSVTLKYGAYSVAMTKSGTTWSASVATESLSGQYRYAILADGKAVDTGIFYVRALVSQYRSVVEAIDTALQGVATNGKYSVSIGEISIQDKTFSEMVAARNYYERMAEADESGVMANLGPKRICEVYG